MSAVIALKTGDGVILFTDLAVYDQQFVICEFKQKVNAAQRVPLAVATRGSERWSELAANTIVGWADDCGVDQAVAMFAEAGPSIYKFDPDLSNHLEVVICCLSPTAGPQIRVFHNVAVGERPVGVLEEDVGRFYLGCGTDGSALPTLRRQNQGEHVVLYASEVGITLMEHFRRLRLPPSDWDVVIAPKHVVGGGVDMTIVNGNGVEVRRILTWPDKIGERINPFADSPNVTVLPPPSPVPAMNRQQQRAAARRSDRAAG